MLIKGMPKNQGESTQTVNIDRPAERAVGEGRLTFYGIRLYHKSLKILNRVTPFYLCNRRNKVVFLEWGRPMSHLPTYDLVWRIWQILQEKSQKTSPLASSPPAPAIPPPLGSTLRRRPLRSPPARSRKPP